MISANFVVAPYVGAWIETNKGFGFIPRFSVAPYVGAWIETVGMPLDDTTRQVAPYVGAWIETADVNDVNKQDDKSHPTWVRGLKPANDYHYFKVVGRTLRGCVD